MNNSPLITPEEWDLIEKYIAEGPETTYLERTESGTMVVFAGGCMHPRAYLQIKVSKADPEPFDILKNVRTPSPNDVIGMMPQSLNGATVKPLDPKKFS